MLTKRKSSLKAMLTMTHAAILALAQVSVPITIKVENKCPFWLVFFCQLTMHLGQARGALDIGFVTQCYSKVPPEEQPCRSSNLQIAGSKYLELDLFRLQNFVSNVKVSSAAFHLSIRTWRVCAESAEWARHLFGLWINLRKSNVNALHDDGLSIFLLELGSTTSLLTQVFRKSI